SDPGRAAHLRRDRRRPRRGADPLRRPGHPVEPAARRRARLARARRLRSDRAAAGLPGPAAGPGPAVRAGLDRGAAPGWERGMTALRRILPPLLLLAALVALSGCGVSLEGASQSGEAGPLEQKTAKVASESGSDKKLPPRPVGTVRID